MMGKAVKRVSVEVPAWLNKFKSLIFQNKRVVSVPGEVLTCVPVEAGRGRIILSLLL